MAGLNGYVKPAAVALGFFLAGFSVSFELHPLSSWLTWVVGGFSSLAPYLIGLASKDPRTNAGSRNLVAPDGPPAPG